MQYTPQQQMGFAGYSVPCRVGNWAEDEYLGALVAEEHKKSLAEGTLTASRLAATIGSASAPIELAAPHGRAGAFAAAKRSPNSASSASAA